MLKKADWIVFSIHSYLLLKKFFIENEFREGQMSVGDIDLCHQMAIGEIAECRTVGRFGHLVDPDSWSTGHLADQTLGRPDSWSTRAKA
jgi:hypothetical protein